MSRKASRTLINRHHQLEKQRRQAATAGDAEAAASASAELASAGGLARYQEASLQGQRLERGGDTSRLLLRWLPSHGIGMGRIRMLEVGALSTRNACSACGRFDMVRIDLESREAGILQQDFMERPLPETEADKFDVISLSLVLNFVPDAEARGRMLARSLFFLRDAVGGTSSGTTVRATSPSLFIVLPRSCVSNSRYLTEARLEEFMDMLGCELVKVKTTQKLAYSLWTRSRNVSLVDVSLTKSEVNPGRVRNNFAITLNSPTAAVP
ncbi:nucleolus protein [Ophiocordyceps camponoti-floridani]|uniref:25S rRNA adenine-N(1) methyltransferase n=1 Tax=Ophiocordyceps camponoti-floridani TaxID=2030778 RepID=A0A8H4Q2E0_9HYPO|nr:nucleolus protein [Ophiocordyceps camponoti-floridani]